MWLRCYVISWKWEDLSSWPHYINNAPHMSEIQLPNTQDEGRKLNHPEFRESCKRIKWKVFLITPICLLSLNVAFVTKDASPDLLFLYVKRHVKWNVIPRSTFFSPNCNITTAQDGSVVSSTGTLRQPPPNRPNIHHSECSVLTYKITALSIADKPSQLLLAIGSDA